LLLLIAADVFVFFLGDNSINKPVASSMRKAELTYQETQLEEQLLQVQPYSASLLGEVNLVQSPSMQRSVLSHISCCAGGTHRRFLLLYDSLMIQ